MALFSITDQIKNALKADLKKHPEVLQGLERVDKGLTALEGLLSRLTMAEIAAALVALNKAVGNKFTDAEIMTAAAEISHLPEGLKAVQAVVEKVEAEVK